MTLTRTTIDDPRSVGDAGSLLGLHTPAARILVAAYVITFAVVSWSDPPAGGLWYEFAAWIVVSVGAISLIAESGGGLYWSVAGIVGAIISSVANAWVLLVEILR